MTREYLKFAIIELTSECNLRCRHCYNWWKIEGSAPRHQNSYNKAFRLLDFLLRHTTTERITFTGGEPTLSERFVELVLHAKLHGKRVTVITNGNGPTEVYHQLAAMRVEMMELSIHAATPALHDSITGVPGSWQKAMDTMQMMLAQGINVTPVVVITRLNSHAVVDAVRTFWKMGIRSVMVNRYNLGGEGLNQPDGLSASAPDLRRAFAQIDAFAAESGIRVFSGVCTPHCLLNPDDYPHVAFGNCSDDVYRRPLTFDLDGNLRMCNHSPIVAGNIYQQSLGEIFASDYVAEWGNYASPFCAGCKRLERCRCGCRAASEQMGLSLQNEDPVVHELGLQPLSNIITVR